MYFHGRLNQLTFRQKNKEKELSREERKKRDALLAKYAYDEEKLDANGDILLSDNSDDKSENINIEKNTNALKIQLEDQRKREQSKKEHIAKVQKDKENKAKEEAKKEKAKQRTQKRERHRGPG